MRPPDNHRIESNAPASDEVAIGASPGAAANVDAASRNAGGADVADTHPVADLSLPDYHPAIWLRNGHSNTIIGGRFRNVDPPVYRRERIETPDGDFLDIDWSTCKEPANGVAIVSHGLEGSSDRPYMRGMARALNQAGWDVAAWNFRGCSGELNRLVRAYHSGATEDIETVIEHVANCGYQRISLVGFSLGGNLTLKYLGERGTDTRIDAAVTISVPCDLTHGIRQIDRGQNRIYAYRFLRSLRDKYVRKARRYPHILDVNAAEQMKTLRDFDDIYTAPIHGFRNAYDYWKQCSSVRFIPEIRVPTLILNAADDPFLAGDCYPHAAAAQSPFVRLHVPDYGGHLGFVDVDEASFEFGTTMKAVAGTSYAERCASEWIRACAD